MADRIVVMHDGIVEQVGTPLDLYDKPDNLFVAGFIGSPSMNFLKGKLDAVAGRPVFKTEGGLTFNVGDAPASSIGRPVTLGMRPEHVSITPDGVPVEVIVVEPTGSETQVNVKNGAQEVVCLFRDRITPKPGETIRIAPNPKLAHLFDGETGKRLVA